MSRRGLHGGPDTLARSGSKGTAGTSWLARHGVTLVLVGLLVAGIGLLAYPSVSNWWNSMHQSRALMTYQDTVSNMDEAQYQAVLSAAEDYNARLAKTGQLWQMSDAQKADYDSQLDVGGTGIMGEIDIPKIDVKLPIYHGTDDAVLQTSIGHLAGTSLPVGGESSHCVLSGHRGLPSARLFTDLDRMTEGDTFSLTILNETLTYEVDQIRIVEPNDLSDLQIEEGQDLCTLVTCTPYGINTQRLLVRGHRIPNPNGDAQIVADAIQVRPTYIAPFLAIPLVLLLVVYLFVAGGRRARKGDPEGAVLEAEGLVRPTPEWLDDQRPGPTLREVLADQLGKRGRRAWSAARNVVGKVGADVGSLLEKDRASEDDDSDDDARDARGIRGARDIRGAAHGMHGAHGTHGEHSERGEHGRHAAKRGGRHGR